MKLYTVGYEGCDIDEFTEALKLNGIEQVADLRKNPVSRKRGFSKRLLGEALAEKKIEYVHMGSLGVPTEWRKQAKEEIITRQKMFRDYVKKILPKQQEDILALQKLMKEKNLALLCYETDASDCHRRFVSDEIQRVTKGKVEVVDLLVRPTEPSLFNLTATLRKAATAKKVSAKTTSAKKAMVKKAASLQTTKSSKTKPVKTTKAGSKRAKSKTEVSVSESTSET